jgi:hypothetical protein
MKTKQNKTKFYFLKFLEFSDAVLVRAIRSYTDNHVGALNFSEGDCITVR